MAALAVHPVLAINRTGTLPRTRVDAVVPPKVTGDRQHGSACATLGQRARSVIPAIRERADWGLRRSPRRRRLPYGLMRRYWLFLMIRTWTDAVRLAADVPGWSRLERLASASIDLRTVACAGLTGRVVPGALVGG